jgi:hypothetical protein
MVFSVRQLLISAAFRFLPNSNELPLAKITVCGVLGLPFRAACSRRFRWTLRHSEKGRSGSSPWRSYPANLTENARCRHCRPRRLHQP